MKNIGYGLNEESVSLTKYHTLLLQERKEKTCEETVYKDQILNFEDT